MKLTYHFHQLKAMLVVASEIENELGLQPVTVETDDGTPLAYNHEDILRLRSGEMTEQEYAERNQINKQDKN